MKVRSLFVLYLTVLFFIQPVLASNHYTFEHAEEMRLSGRIDWREYGPDAFEDAIDQNKPIFLMLTAPSWCYWCHVYTSDDYVYNEQVYPIINDNFIPIYVDADKRQDLTRKYLEGGWPSTTVMTPNRQRLYGYSGPRPIPNMIENLNNAIANVQGNTYSNSFELSYTPSKQNLPTENQLINSVNSYANNILRSHDSEQGGFGTGKKFPQGRAMDYALEYYDTTNDVEFLQLVQTTLQYQYTKIEELKTNYNLFDPIDGGFHRYGTTRSYTPPHYEKMLYDNARLLKAYGHLQQITPDDSLVNEVVEITHNFILTNWFDSEEGGFYGNSDVHGEDAYYGKNPRPENKPRVEKTKYSDWNSDAIVTYLYLWDISGDSTYKDMAEQSLDFYASEMVTKDGVYHFKKDDGTKGVRGNILDNSNLIVAFVEGYESLGKDSYLENAQILADYSLEYLYDWPSGGFFERNSKDTELYAPGEQFDLSKPSHENGIISYGLLKLYLQTDDIRYLNAGLKTLGSRYGQYGGLDRAYYYVQAAQLTIDNDLLSAYQTHHEEINVIEQQEIENFWVTRLIIQQEQLKNLGPTGFVVSNVGLVQLEGPIFLLSLIALLAGFISFASPCTLPILPAFVAYSFRSSKQNIKGMTIAFFLGLTLIFTLLGMSVTFIGGFLKSQLTFFTQIAGAGLMLFGVYIMFGKGFSGIQIRKKKPTTYLGSFLFGSVLGLSWTPCVGPILVAVLLMASTAGSVYGGGFLLFVYSLGLAIPLLIVSASLEKINKESKLWKLIEGKELRFKFGDSEKIYTIHTSSLISGTLFVILGFLIFSGVLFTFNQYLATTSFQKYIFGIEEFLLNILR